MTATPRKRTALQRLASAKRKAASCYKDWQMSEAGSRRARALHRRYTRYVEYAHALADMALMFDYDDTSV